MTQPKFTNEQAEQAAILQIIPRREGISFNEVYARVLTRWHYDGHEEAVILVYKNGDSLNPIGRCVFDETIIIPFSDYYKREVLAQF